MPIRSSAPTAPKRADAASCPHCGAAVEGSVDAYCCHGCELAAAIVRDAGLERYYREREACAPRPEPLNGSWADVPTEQRDDGSVAVRLSIEGLRCASCVWVTEKVLQQTAGVRSAQISYASGRAAICWDPAVTDLPALARKIAMLGYRPRPLTERATPDRSLLVRMGVAGMATLFIMGLYEGLYAGWWYGGMDPRFATLFRWLSLLLATPVTIWCAEPFFAGAWNGLRHRLLHMDLPIALGIALMYVHGVATTIGGETGYLDSLAMLVALLLAGRVLESHSRRRATEAASALAGSVPRSARRVANNSSGEVERVETVPVGQLRLGDLIDLGAGEEFAADGLVVQGSGQVRMALITGEATPVPVIPGDRVIAGTMLLDGALTISVEALGEETVIQRMARQLRLSQDRAMTPGATDRIAPWFTMATLLAALGTFALWVPSHGLALAISRTVAVLVVACPCALALAQPLAAAAGLGAAARRGLLLRSSDSLLKLAEVSAAGVDKTGTVTEGTIKVLAASDDTLRIAAALERYSVHPVALAITGEAARRGIPLPQAIDLTETPGVGISGRVDGIRWSLQSGGAGRLELGREGEPAGAGWIDLGDGIRPDSAEALAELERLGVEVTMLTGDHEKTGASVAARIGVNARTRMTPETKVDWIRAAQIAGEKVLFAGDGLNDGPALAAADVGIAMAGGVASSVLVADGIVATGSLKPLAEGVRAARLAQRAARRSQMQSIGYNLIAVLAAAAGWVNPLVAALLMPLSSVTVIWNAAVIERAMKRSQT